jgi:hypothetical protein
MRRLGLSLLTIGMLAAGCGHPLIPAADTRPAPAPSRPAKKPDPAVTSAATSAAPAQVPGPPVVGVDLYALSDYPAAEVETDGQRTLEYIKTVLKADAVGIVWNLYSPGRTSDRVRATSSTLSPAGVWVLTELAEQDGLKVFYRPLIFISGTSRDWEGNITPAHPSQWFNSYYRAELPYLRAAQDLGVSEFVAQTEMHAMNTNRGWPAFFTRIAKVYHGVVSYASWDGDFFPPDGHLQHLPALGLDMYEAMPHLAAGAPESRVLARWDAFFSTVPASVLKRTTIQEMGIEARAGAYQDPPNLGARGRLDQQVQAYWFTAACHAVRKYDMRGIFFWKVDLTDNPEFPATSLSTFEGKRGADAIAACAGIIGAGS